MAATAMEQKPKLIIEPPNELHFCGPFTRPVVTIMKLRNQSGHKILFKIKTTAPKRYCVRPNFGSIDPLSVASVEICLQPFVYDPNEKNKHKFMVQSMVAPDDVVELDLNKLWKEMDPELLVDAKLKCVFEMPDAASIAEKSVNAMAERIKESSPKALGEEKISNLPSWNTEKLVSEMMQIKGENTDLRKDNQNLKDQIVRLKDELYAPAEKQIPMFYIAITVAVAVFCLLLGKYLL